MIGMSSPGKLYDVEKLANFHFDEIEKLLVVDHVDTC